MTYILQCNSIKTRKRHTVVGYSVHGKTRIAMHHVSQSHCFCWYQNVIVVHSGLLEYLVDVNEKNG